MPLTNTQYDQIMRGYQDRQLKRQQLIDTRREEIAAKIPKITELDAQIASLSVDGQTAVGWRCLCPDGSARSNPDPFCP